MNIEDIGTLYSGGYSKITTIELINFMVYKHAKISFDEKNIINLKGYNSAGKSSILRALSICFLDAYKKRQTRLIRYGEDYFRIVVSFDDGVRIIRDKYINGQSLYEMYCGDDLLYTTREGNSLSRVDDVPEPIKQYLGLISTESGCLNYQTRSNKLWLVETAGSENYYSLNEVLKTESIARANTLLNNDKNKLGGEITEIEAELQSAELALQGCAAVSEELLGALVEKESYVKEVLRRQRAIEKLLNICETLEKLKPVPDVVGIDSSRLSEVSKLKKSVLDLENLREIPKVESLETGKLSGIASLLDSVSKLEKVEGTVVGADIERVEYENIPSLNALRRTIRDLAKCAEEYNGVVAEYKNVRGQLKKVVDDAGKRGMKFVKCDNCGTYMEVSTSA